MALKHLLARIFKRFKKSGSASALDVTAAATSAPASNVSPLCVAPLTERSPATQAIFSVNVNLRFHVLFPPTTDCAHALIQHSQVLPTLSTGCEGHAHTQGSAPLLETSSSNTPVEFNIETTATEFEAIPNSVLSSVQGLDLFGLGTTCPQGMQR